MTAPGTWHPWAHQPLHCLCSSLSAEKAAVAEAEEEPAGTCLRLHQAVVRNISEICRVVNQVLLGGRG